jgi:hypothetical protein
MVGILASSVVHHGFKHLSGQTKDYEIGIVWYHMYVVLSSKSKDLWLPQNQDNEICLKSD